MLSERGRVTVDERTNTLLVLETREKIEEIRQLVSRLDIPVRQVLIESRIVVANEDFARDIGTKFGVSTIGSSGGTRRSEEHTSELQSLMRISYAVFCLKKKKKQKNKE